MHSKKLPTLYFSYLLRMDAYRRSGEGKENASFQHFQKHEYFIHFVLRISAILDVEEEWMSFRLGLNR